jgi:hypothetical protein
VSLLGVNAAVADKALCHGQFAFSAYGEEMHLQPGAVCHCRPWPS